MTEGRRCGSGKGGRDRGSRRGHGRGLRVRQGQGRPGRCDPAQSLGEPDPGLDADLDSDHHYVQPSASGVRQIEQVGEGVLSWERVSMTVGSSSMRGGVEAGRGVVGGVVWGVLAFQPPWAGSVCMHVRGHKAGQDSLPEL